MNQELLKSVLVFVASKLNDNKINWALIGSFNLFLQGINTNVKDVDILVSFNDYEKVKESFSDFSIKDESKLSNGDGIETRYLIYDVEVQFCFEYDDGFYIKKLIKGFNQGNLVSLELDSVNIFCLRLQDELKGYKYLGRDEKVKIIEGFLNNTKRN